MFSKSILLILGLVVPAFSQVLLECNFEEPCTFVDETGIDDYDWIKNSGGTPSSSTGPDNDHTLGTGAGSYMYFEASSITPGDNAMLTSGSIETQNGEGYCLTFWYHMRGEDVGSLTVESVVSDATKEVWAVSADQGQEWVEAEVTITATADGEMRLRFTAVKGGGDAGEPYGDIAIDDIRVTRGNCGAAPPTTTPAATTTTASTTTTTTTLPTTTTASTTTTTTTAPTTTTTTRATTTTTRATTRAPTTPSSTPAITTTRATTTTTRATTRSPTTPSSITPPTTTRPTPPSTVRPTPNPTSTTAPPSVRPSMVPGITWGCDMEEGAMGSVMLPCNLRQSTTDDFDWRIHSGDTANSGTGPSFGQGETGKYLYTDASGIVGGSKATIMTGSFTLTQQACLVFYYHMYGSDIGSLSVSENMAGSSREAWKLTGSQGDMWKMAEVGLFSSATSVSITATKAGVDEKSAAGDIAIDSLELRAGPCAAGPLTTTTTTTQQPESGSGTEDDNDSLWGVESNIWIIILVCAGALVLILLVIICIQACALHNLRKAKLNMAVNNDYSEIGYSTTHSRKSHQDYITAYDSVDVESKRNSNNSAPAMAGNTNPAYDGQQTSGFDGNHQDVTSADSNGGSYLHQY